MDAKELMDYNNALKQIEYQKQQLRSFYNVGEKCFGHEAMDGKDLIAEIIKLQKPFPYNKVSESMDAEIKKYISDINIKTEPLWTNTIKNNLMVFYSWLLERNYFKTK